MSCSESLREMWPWRFVLFSFFVCLSYVHISTTSRNALLVFFMYSRRTKSLEVVLGIKALPRTIDEWQYLCQHELPN